MGDIGDFKKKYLKYKNKYFKLQQNKLEGGMRAIKAAMEVREDDREKTQLVNNIITKLAQILSFETSFETYDEAFLVALNKKIDLVLQYIEENQPQEKEPNSNYNNLSIESLEQIIESLGEIQINEELKQSFTNSINNIFKVYNENKNKNDKYNYISSFSCNNDFKLHLQFNPSWGPSGERNYLRFYYKGFPMTIIYGSVLYTIMNGEDKNYASIVLKRYSLDRLLELLKSTLNMKKKYEQDLQETARIEAIINTNKLTYEQLLQVGVNNTRIYYQNQKRNPWDHELKYKKLGTLLEKQYLFKTEKETGGRDGQWKTYFVKLQFQHDTIIFVISEKELTQVLKINLGIITQEITQEDIGKMVSVSGINTIKLFYDDQL